MLDGDPAPSPQKGAGAPIFSPRLLWPNGCMDQDATGYEVGLSPGDCDRWGLRYPRKKAHPPPSNFLPMAIVDEDATSYRSRPRPRPHCIRQGPSSPRKGTAAPSYRPMSTVATVRPYQLLLSSCTRLEASVYIIILNCLVLKSLNSVHSD